MAGNSRKVIASDRLAFLNETRLFFNEGPRHGEGFLYHTNDEQWRDPYESPYGFHLVTLAQRTEGRYPAFAEINDRVLNDAQRAW